MKSDSVVIIPTYNEKENIQKMIETVLAINEHQFDILVIDDNSPDGTGEIVDRMIANDLAITQLEIDYKKIKESK